MYNLKEVEDTSVSVDHSKKNEMVKLIAKTKHFLVMCLSIKHQQNSEKYVRKQDHLVRKKNINGTKTPASKCDFFHIYEQLYEVHSEK